MLRRFNIILVVAIILCSTSFYQLSILGNLQQGMEILGILLILVFLILHIVYAKQKPQIPQKFSIFIILILISFITSAFMVNYTRNQSFEQTLYAQRAIFYYLFYFLLHQLKVNIRDLQKIFIYFGIVYIVFYLLQYFAYPYRIFDAFILAHRGTVRVYLAGSDYLAILFFLYAQRFFQFNKLKYLLVVIGAYSLYILLGGRGTMVIMAFTFVIFLLFSRKVKSRFGITILIALASILFLFLFQGIFEELLQDSMRDRNLGKNYVRFVATKFFLTDFYKSSMAYFTGNGVPGLSGDYPREMMGIKNKGYFLGDIGTIGLYIQYGILFLIGVLGICYKALVTKLNENYIYLRYMYLAIIISLPAGAGFGNSDFICFITLTLYMIEVSNYSTIKEKESISA